jgi:hypothetical protein
VRESLPVVETIFKRLTALGEGKRERRDPAQLAELWALCGAESTEQRYPSHEHRRGDRAVFSFGVRNSRFGDYWTLARDAVQQWGRS